MCHGIQDLLSIPFMENTVSNLHHYKIFICINSCLSYDNFNGMKMLLDLQNAEVSITECRIRDILWSPSKVQVCKASEIFSQIKLTLLVLGLNSGVMLMNLTRMREFGWTDYVTPIMLKWKLYIPWGDQVCSF